MKWFIIIMTMVILQPFSAFAEDETEHETEHQTEHETEHENGHSGHGDTEVPDLADFEELASDISELVSVDGDILSIDLSKVGDFVSHIIEAVAGSMEHLSETLDHGPPRDLMATGEGDRDFSEKKAASPAGKVNIQNVSGSVEVIGWDRDEVMVEGRLEEHVRGIEFEVRGDRTEIEVVVEKGRRRGRSAYLTIHVPSGSSVEVEAVSAPISISDVLGDTIDVEVVSGKIRVENCRGDVDAETVSGSIVISGEPTSVNAEAVSGSIDVVAGALTRCELSSVSGSVDFKGSLGDHGRLEVEVVSGSVDLKFTDEVFGRYDISTFSGGIRCDFGPEPTRTSKYSPGRQLHFSHGDGNARVSVETFSGSVRIGGP